LYSNNISAYYKNGPGSVVGIATELRAGRSGDRITVGARFSAPVQTGPEGHPASCVMGTGSFPGVRCGRGVTLTPHLLLVPRSYTVELYEIPLLSLRVFVAYEMAKPTYILQEYFPVS
jgi:hypothetical protein